MYKVVLFSFCKATDTYFIHIASGRSNAYTLTRQCSDAIRKGKTGRVIIRGWNISQKLQQYFEVMVWKPRSLFAH